MMSLMLLLLFTDGPAEKGRHGQRKAARVHLNRARPMESYPCNCDSAKTYRSSQCPTSPSNLSERHWRLWNPWAFTGQLQLGSFRARAWRLEPEVPSWDLDSPCRTWVGLEVLLKEVKVGGILAFWMVRKGADLWHNASSAASFHSSNGSAEARTCGGQA